MINDALVTCFRPSLLIVLPLKFRVLSTVLGLLLTFLPTSNNILISEACASLTQSTQEKKRVEGQQAHVKKQLSSLEAELQAKEARSEATSRELQKADQAISKANRRLRELREKRNQLEAELQKLRRSGSAVADNLKDAEETVSVIARAQYLNSRRNVWKSLIDGTNPNSLASDSGKLRYLAREQDRAIDQLSKRHHNILNVTEERNQQRLELTKIQEAEERERQDLLKDKRDRQTALGKLRSEIKSQQADIERLKKDQGRLASLILQIDKRIEQQRLAEAAKKQPRNGNTSSRGTKPYQGTNFASLKGKLTVPVRGTVTAHYGLSRGQRGTTWQGIRYRANEGSDVVACAPGKVVFSDWLRGFGNLIIIDHGNTYMSVYANNESIFKNVGDIVKQGETISSVGSSGGASEPGLYFELRYRSKPINPRSWLKH